MADNLINSSNFEQSRNFLELNGLNAIRQQSKETDGDSKKAALQEAAQQFEAIFMQMLLKSMRKAQDVLESDSPFNSESTKFYRDMSDQQMAVELSSNGSLGLTDLIVRQLGGGDDNFTPRTVLRNDANLENINLTREPASTHLPNANPFAIFSEDNQSAGSKSTSNLATQTSNDSLSQAPFRPLKMTTEGPSGDDKSVNFSTPSFAEPKDFVTALIEPAKKVEEKIGVPFQVIIAQAALETGWGQKIIKDQQGSSSNNLFNIKADNRWDGEHIQKDTLEFEQGAMVKKSAPFRAYESLNDSFNDYANFLTNNDRYQGALQNSGNVEHFLQGLQQAGYATDPQYANKIMATLRTVSNLITK
ncbi:flagellar assembly peptidoglycan hydrolase FlgJ [Colwellia sp. 1_MG-2023]|uniref:flagellar assembly peptidoglycan hydrolase FlgJ n=1 Tax=unclassified Colwellia TaxID=196834 RepID=UPI001C0922E0|nr:MULTISPECIES: flagellar assembly peptidoglycan hydrolase FlgJ [unclassified Colwellia]MBU2923261.1 flagellar assembly peptidoglycan hydrolase FlgJ [Colwellia sp. C2M11]MDO6654018.1 flagellar assembly peptidoglycan hydrolase FlgJ [Colwellia sp. 3_MG-2023]MDO6666966.1 flagellar assembly peptidoglycan hydrolase FlgJ [Colwellia sp. 2_MG-2023]MDO6691340.1 flagellar assembly peptidoglycan hydrolase FlgJ [Colwellia sp. 1_MG-2023]